MTEVITTTPKRTGQKKQNKLGAYNLLQTLGEGEFGKVKLGVHTETGEEVAIKLIKKDGAGSDNRINKVEREISILKNLKHPYIVKLHNVIETEKYVGLVLEYASGGELFEYILAHRYLKERDAKRFFAQLISSVQYMHKCKIVHRDLKLENILIDKDRNIIVTDFGFANQFSTAADDMMATTCGSPCYAAPELVVNAGLYAGSAVDIWSCGVILFAMLSGFLPFDDDPTNPDSDDINQLYRYIVSTRLTFPAHISPEARDLMEKMLVPDPAKRCTLDAVIKHSWLSAYKDLLSRDQRPADTRPKPTQIKKAARNQSTRSSRITHLISRKQPKEPKPFEGTPEKSVSTSYIPANNPAPPHREKLRGFFAKAKPNEEESETSTLGNSSFTLLDSAPQSILLRLAQDGEVSPTPKRGSVAYEPAEVPAYTGPIEPNYSTRFTKGVAAVRKSIYRKSPDSLKTDPKPQRNTWSIPDRSPPKKTGKKMMDWIKKRSHAKQDSLHSQQDSPRPSRELPKEKIFKQNSKKDSPPASETSRVKKSEKKAVQRCEAESVKKNEIETAKKSRQTRDEKDTTREEHKLAKEKPANIPTRTRTLSSNALAFSREESMGDIRIQIHQGPIDRTALTSRAPQKVIKESARILSILGIESISDEDGPFVLRCTRKKASQRKEDCTLQPIYGEPAIDNGEEIIFTVEICRFKNLPGLFIVDIKRLKGNVWAYKFLYHKLIDFLDLTCETLAKKKVCVSTQDCLDDLY